MGCSALRIPNSPKGHCLLPSSRTRAGTSENTGSSLTFVNTSWKGFSCFSSPSKGTEKNSKEITEVSASTVCFKPLPHAGLSGFRRPDRPALLGRASGERAVPRSPSRPPRPANARPRPSASPPPQGWGGGVMRPGPAAAPAPSGVKRRSTAPRQGGWATSHPSLQHRGRG